MGKPGVLTRSYRAGRKEFFRINRGDTLNLKITFEAVHPKPAVVLLANINTKPEAWQEHRFEQLDDKTFGLEIQCSTSGRFCFRAKYTLDGQEWFWDCVPFSYIIVDSTLHSTVRTYTLVTSSAGHIGDWTRMLPHISDLNCNVLHLLPVTTLCRSQSPYAAKDLFSLDPAYMDPSCPDDGMTQFSNFVDAAMEHGIHICIDLVFNHVSMESEIVRAHPDWIQADEKEPDGMRRAGWSAGETWHKWQNLVLLDYDNPDESVRGELWRYMRHYAIFWAQFAARTYGMIRLDNLHSSNPRFMRFVIAELRKTFPELIVFAELFTHSALTPEIVWDYELNLLLGTPWEHRFVPQLRDYLAETHKRFSQAPYILPITSHDSGTPAQEFGTAKSTVPRYVACALMGCGATGLVQGVEYGLPKKLSLVGLHPPPDCNTGHNYTSFIAEINRIMAEHRVFRGNGNMRFIDDGHDAIIAAYRFDPQNMSHEFIVLANFDTEHRQHILLDLKRHVPHRQAESFQDILTGITLKPVDGHIDIAMDPCSAMALRLL
jgi:starch synthase (maltosyl-transferring)